MDCKQCAKCVSQLSQKYLSYKNLDQPKTRALFFYFSSVLQNFLAYKMTAMQIATSCNILLCQFLRISSHKSDVFISSTGCSKGVCFIAPVIFIIYTESVRSDPHPSPMTTVILDHQIMMVEMIYIFKLLVIFTIIGAKLIAFYSRKSSQTLVDLILSLLMLNILNILAQFYATICNEVIRVSIFSADFMPFPNSNLFLRLVINQNFVVHSLILPILSYYSDYNPFVYLLLTPFS